MGFPEHIEMEGAHKTMGFPECIEMEGAHMGFPELMEMEEHIWVFLSA